jgi:hypothetical protein
MRFWLAHRHIARSGAMMLFPNWVKEYSTATRFEVVTLLAILKIRDYVEFW